MEEEAMKPKESLKGPRRTSEILEDTFLVLQDWHQGKHRSLANTGFSDLDGMLGGLHPGELIVLASRPGMGKTAVAMAIACNVARYTESPRAVVYFSLDTDRKMLLLRQLCAESRVNIHRARMGQLSKTELHSLARVAGPINEQELYIDDASSISSSHVREKALQVHEKTRHLGLIIIDQLQGMSSIDESKPRTEQLERIVRDLKALARELQVPVIVLSHVSRAAEERKGDHRPLLSDLAGTAALEQIADVVLFVHRECMYSRDPVARNLADIIIAKQRNGASGVWVKLRLESEFGFFEGLHEYELRRSQVIPDQGVF